MSYEDETDESDTALMMVPEVLPARPDVELAILSIDPTVHLDRVCEAVTKLDSIKAWIKQQEAILKPLVIAYIQANGEFSIGEEKFYVGSRKETKCIDLFGAILALLKAAEKTNPETGEVTIDLRRFVDALSVRAIKPSVAKKDLDPKEFAVLFSTQEKHSLKRECTGPELQRLNTRFLR